MKKPLIYVVSNSEIESFAIAERLKPLNDEFDGGLSCTTLDIQNLKKITDDASCVFLNLPRWSTQSPDTLNHVREKFKGPIIMVVSDLALWAGRSRTWPNLRGVGFLERPVEDAELKGLVRRVCLSKSNKFRAFPRYEVELPARMSLHDEPSPIECTIRNVSHGGACLVLPELNTSELFVGQFATLSFVLDGQATPRDVRFRVAWLEPARSLMGAEFVQTIRL